ncbi:MAG: M4 family metallopeptidase, partial [Bacteroidota bacterium]
TYIWENPFWEGEIKRKSGNSDATYFPHGELYWGWSASGSDQPGNFSLTYRFDIYPDGSSSSQRVLVDATTGQIVNSFPLESDCSSASVNTIWNGSQTIFSDKYTAHDFRLKDDSQSAEIWIRDWGSTTLTASPTEIENTTNTWTTMNERFGATVLWHTKESYLYFLNVHSRNSYDNSNGDVTGYINAVFDCSPPAGCTSTNNASMSFSGGTMKVGLGSSGTLANSWGTLDIIGHGYTHAVTGSSSQLVYQGESGALNESFSDIFGEAIERRSTGANDWLMGDDRTNGAIRSLQNPNANGDPDTYLGTNWASTCGTCSDNGGVHTNSGVQNYWFYLLGVGNGTVTTGTNDNGNSYSVSGVGFGAARAIAYRNNVVKLTTNSNYASARAGAIASAEDIYGACSNEVIQVKNAWYAVGIGTPGMPAFNSSYTESGTCSNDPFSIDLQSKITANIVTPSYTWTVDYNGLIGGNGDCPGGCVTTIDETLINNSSASITAVYTLTPFYDGCSGSSFVINKTVYPIPVGINSIEDVLCSEDPFSIDLQSKISNSVASNFSWTVDYNGLTGGNGPGSGDFINEALYNNTGVIAAAVYTVSPESEAGSCPGDAFTVTVQVPPKLLIDAGENQTVYYGYPPAECANLSWSGDIGGVPPYSYMWSTGETNQQITVCPGEFTTDYSVTITDANGCTYTDYLTVCVIDVRCGQELNKVEICHIPPGQIGVDDKSVTICVAVEAVEKHINHGDILAACGTDHNCPPAKSGQLFVTEKTYGNELSVYPNPFNQSTTVSFSSSIEGDVTLILMDITGKKIKELFNGNVESGRLYEVDIKKGILKPGLNYCIMQLSDGTVMTQKLIVNK